MIRGNGTAGDDGGGGGGAGGSGEDGRVHDVPGLLLRRVLQAGGQQQEAGGGVGGAAQVGRGQRVQPGERALQQAQVCCVGLKENMSISSL